MIRPEQFPKALKAIQSLIVQAKSLAYEAGEGRLAELLNDVELLPEFVADEQDRTEAFLEMLQGITQVNPNLQYILEEYDNNSSNLPFVAG